MAGLEKLTKYTAQLKSDYEFKLKDLKDMVIALESENRILKTQLESYEMEVETTRRMVHQLKVENSRKWRVEEREDWKALVASIQEDRKALQGENERLLAINAQLQANTENQLSIGQEMLDSKIHPNGGQGHQPAYSLDDEHININNTSRSTTANGSAHPAAARGGPGSSAARAAQATDPRRDLELERAQFRTYQGAMEAHCGELEQEVQRLQQELALHLYRRQRGDGGPGAGGARRRKGGVLGFLFGGGGRGRWEDDGGLVKPPVFQV